MDMYTRVIIESPYAGDVELNIKYLNIMLRDSILNRQEAPFASHGLYTTCLDDNIPAERHTGIHAGFAWQGVVDKMVVCYDLGISEGMRNAVDSAEKLELPVEYRKLNLTKADIMNYNFHRIVD